MVTTDRLAQLHADALQLEQRLRADWEQATGSEKDTARGVMRQAVQVRKSLESWIAQRALGAGLARR